MGSDHTGSFGVSARRCGHAGLWFADELVTCAGWAVARSGDGDLFFVGRSLDSMFDLLGGAFDGTPWATRLHRLPLSFAISGRMVANRWRPARITQAQVAQGRQILDRLGVSPYALARRDRPATFVDVVHSGSTFTKLLGLLRNWVEQQREPWDVIRRKIRFVGVTSRTKTSPNTYRWQQHAAWTRDLPARSVLNVSLDPFVWSYLGDRQIKLTRTFRPEAWLADAEGPQRGERTSAAVAEAVALVELGRTGEARRDVARAMSGDPAIAQPWLRTLIGQLHAGAGRG